MSRINMSFNKNTTAGDQATSEDKIELLFDTDTKELYRESGEMLTKENLLENEKNILESFLRNNKDAYKDPKKHPVASSPDGSPVEGKDPAVAAFMLQIGYDTVCLIEKLLA